MEARFETAFLKAVKKHASIKKLVRKKVDMILENPIAVGEPLKGNWQGFYSCPVKRNFIIKKRRRCRSGLLGLPGNTGQDHQVRPARAS